MQRDCQKNQYNNLFFCYYQGCLEETRQEALHLAKEIQVEVKRLGGNEKLEQVIQMLSKVLEEQISFANYLLINTIMNTLSFPHSFYQNKLIRQ